MVENTSKCNQKNLNLVYPVITTNFVFQKCLALYCNAIGRFGSTSDCWNFFEDRSKRFRNTRNSGSYQNFQDNYCTFAILAVVSNNMFFILQLKNKLAV